MIQKFLRQTSSTNLTLFFAGWGMDSTPFLGYESGDADLMICYDYTSADFDYSLIKGYDCIRIVAWSMGVKMASIVAPQIDYVWAVALNGTPWAVDENRGIDPIIFNGTLLGLCERSLEKFHKRMCGSLDDYRRFCESRPQRSIDSLKAELKAIAEYEIVRPLKWNLAIVGLRDMIFTADNQKNAWQQYAQVMIDSVDEAHYCELRLRYLLYWDDKRLVRQCFNRAAATYDNSAVMQSEIAKRLINAVKRNVPLSVLYHKRGIEVGCGTGLLTRELISQFDPERLFLNDLSPVMIESCRKTFGDSPSYLCGDAEMMTFPSDCSFVFSASAVQWFRDVSNFFRSAAHSLASGGVLAFSSFGQNNFREIRELTSQGLEYRTVDSLKELLKDEFDIKEAYDEECKLYFNTPADVLRHIKLCGVAGVSHFRWTHRRLAEFENNYNRKFRDDRGLSLTYHPIYIVAIKK